MSKELLLIGSKIVCNIDGTVLVKDKRYLIIDKIRVLQVGGAANFDNYVVRSVEVGNSKSKIIIINPFVLQSCSIDNSIN